MLADAEAAQRERQRADQAGEALVEIITAVEAAARQVDAIAVSARSATQGTRALGDLMQPVLLVAESNAVATRQMTGQIESAAEAMSSEREGTEALSGTAERLRRLISQFRLTEARRQSVDIPVSARCASWTGLRTARRVKHVGQAELDTQRAIAETLDGAETNPDHKRHACLGRRHADWPAATD